MLSRHDTYQLPFDTGGTYRKEPTDAQSNMLARALAHWFTAYGRDEGRTVESVVLDILESNGGSAEAMTRDECVAIANVFGLEV